MNKLLTLLWRLFKNSVYVIGWTVCVILITIGNLDILREMWWTAPWWAIIAIILITTSLYPMWVIGLIGIVKLWKQEIENAQINQESHLSGSSG